jgi:tryptophan synthase beta chain
MSSLISHLYETGQIEAVAKPQTECFSAGGAVRPHGGHPARPGAHARDGGNGRGSAAVQEDRRGKVTLTAQCGHGHLDLTAFDAYNSGNVVDHEWEDADVQAAVADALSRLPALA